MIRSNSRLPLPAIDPMAVLEHTRGLQRLSKDELRGLAAALRLTRYPSGTVFFKDFEGNLAAPLRIIVQGQLFRTAIASSETAGAPTIDAGALFGLASVNRWARTHEPSRKWAVDDDPGFVAEAHDELWVLELDPRDYHRAFARPEYARLVSRLLGLYGAGPHEARVVRALRRTPEFSRSCPMHVSRLAEGGVLEHWPVGVTIFDPGEPEHMALRYVVSGTVQVTDEDTGLSTVVAAGGLIPHHHIFSNEGPGRTFTAVGDEPAEVIRIRRATVDFTIRTTPGFARMLGPSTLGAWLDEPHANQPAFPVIASGEMSLVIADPDAEPLPIRELVELLALAMREHLGDGVWVVRLVPERLHDEPQHSSLGVPETIVVPEGPRLGPAVRAALVELATQWGLLFDQIIIDPSALELSRDDRLALMRAMVSLPCPSQISYLVASPRDWAELPERLGIVSGVHILPTALLGPPPPAIELRKSLRELGEWIYEGGSRSSRKPGRLRDKLGRQGRSSRSWLGQNLHAAGQLLGVPSAYPTPWPLGAVRLRLSDHLLALLDRQAEDDPALHFDSLELDADEAAHAREVFERWARAVTWRRIGIGIGGAGSQSYSAVPFIRALREAGIPVDVMSGSSTGAFISAFYSALGDAGLDEVIAKRHHFGFGVAISWFHNWPFELLLTHELRALDLNDLEIPVIAVAARAADGETAYLASSSAGQACMASGSLPPMVPTYVRNRRLLDGGLTQDVPTAVLSSAGAELIIGVQSIPRVNPNRLQRQDVFIPPQLRAMSTVNPLQRLLDYYRSYLMLFRQAARSEDDNADVIYEATTKSSHAGAFFQAKRIAEEAAPTPALRKAVDAAVAEWRWMLLRPPGRVTLDTDSGKFVLGNSTTIALEGRRRFTKTEIPRHSRTILHSVALFINRHAEFDLHAWLCVPESKSDEEVEGWLERIDEALAGEGEHIQRRCERTVVRSHKHRQVFLELGVIPTKSEESGGKRRPEPAAQAIAYGADEGPEIEGRASELEPAANDDASPLAPEPGSDPGAGKV